jgi:hypothetical protein
MLKYKNHRHGSRELPAVPNYEENNVFVSETCFPATLIFTLWSIFYYSTGQALSRQRERGLMKIFVTL